jgi:DNA primase
MAIQGSKKTELTMDSILEKVSDYDIFKWYMPTKDWKLNEITYSPFRTEKHPSFLIGNKRGYISFIDFGNTQFRGDCFTFVKLLYNLANLDEILKKIDSDFGLGISSNEIKDYKKITGEYKQPEIVKRNTLIQVTTRKFTNEELAYWNAYHQNITDLRENEVYSIKDVYLNKKKFPLKSTDLRFGYFYNGYWKIYRPFASKKEKWFPNNTPITMMDGKEDIRGCKTAFINKSKKDHMVIKKLFPCSCAVQNEGIACFSPENVEYIKNNSETQILSFDSDVTGVKNSQQITELFGFGYCNVPRKYLQEGIKDWADLAKIHGMQAVEEVLKQKQLL